MVSCSLSFAACPLASVVSLQKLSEVRSLVSYIYVLLQLKYALRFDLVSWRLGVLVCFVLEIGERGKHRLSGGLLLEGIPRAVLGACAEPSAC